MLGELNENDLQSCDAGVFHCRNAIGVAGDEHNAIDRPIRRERRHIQTDAHIDALLLEIRFEVSIGQLFFGNRNASRLEPAKFQYAAPDREQIPGSQIPQPPVISFEFHRFAGNRFPDLAVVGRTIVVKDADEALSLHDTTQGKSLNEIRIVSMTILPSEDSEMASINHHGDFYHNGNPIEKGPDTFVPGPRIKPAYGRSG